MPRWPRVVVVPEDCRRRRDVVDALQAGSTFLQDAFVVIRVAVDGDDVAITDLQPNEEWGALMVRYEKRLRTHGFHVRADPGPLYP